jgi:hypothetical protein
MVDAKSKGGKAGASKDSKAKAVTQSSRAGLQVSEEDRDKVVLFKDA